SFIENTSRGSSSSLDCEKIIHWVMQIYFFPTDFVYVIENLKITFIQERPAPEPNDKKLQKANREKQRRDPVNEQFTELGKTLDPERPKFDKETILGDTIQMLNDLAAQVGRLKSEYTTVTTLTEESRELRVWKHDITITSYRFGSRNKKSKEEDEMFSLVTVINSAKQFGRAIIVLNLKPPVTTTATVVSYHDSILKALQGKTDFTPLMTLYLVDKTSPDEIKLANDWHLYLCDGELLEVIVSRSAKQFGRAIIVLNLKPPVTTTATVVSYHDSILKALQGKTDFTPLMTLYLVDKTSPDEIKLANSKGFNNAQITYLGGLWVMIKLESIKAKSNLLKHVGVLSWFSRLCSSTLDFVAKDRIVWVDIEGVPLHAWSRPTFIKIGSKWGEVMEIDEGKDDNFARKRLCIKTSWADNILESFKIIVKGKVFRVRVKELFVWSSSFVDVPEMVQRADDESDHGDDAVSVPNKVDNESDNDAVSDMYFGDNDHENADAQECDKDKGQHENGHEASSDPFNIYDLLNKQKRVSSKVDDCSSRVFKEVEKSHVSFSTGKTRIGSIHKEGGSMLEVLEEMIKAKKKLVRELVTKNNVSFLTLQETKMENIIDMDAKLLWGNYLFYHTFSEALGNSGGILCVWDTNVFSKDHHVISDNFVALYGTWTPKKLKLLIISVPVCGGALGVYFSPQGASSFNDFISCSGLIEVQLEGYSFTWAHPSAAKMSKLNHFLASDGIFASFPHLSAICLDRHLSDHRPILLRELVTDYGATPFRIYHSWFSISVFEQMVTTTYIKDKLSDIDKLIDCGKVNDDILLSRLDLSKQLHDLDTSASYDFMQKAKIRWAIKGDENSKFFHGVINRKRVNLTVKGVLVDGEWVDDPGCVKNEFWSHFAARFQDPRSRRGRLSFPFPNRLSQDQLSDLEAPISIEEVRSAVSFAVGCNSSFVALIPKTLDPKAVHDFRPISLIRSLYKVVTKILANRLSLVISHLISDVQTAFLPNRQILDGPFILNKGDLLAPFLFLLVMESFHLAFSWAVDDGLFTGIRINSNVLISHLFYADDAVFLGDWSTNNLKGILKILKCFSLLSGLSINLKKSHLLGIGLRDSIISEVADSISCSVLKNPFKYLGVMVGGAMSLVKSWDDTVANLVKRLSKWKLKTLSIGGRLTLLKSVLGSSPIYNMSLFKVPKLVLNMMESFHRNFFNGSQEGEKKIAWVKWSKVLAPKKLGGLGVYSFFALNRALFAKWVWRFLSHDNSLWYRVISGIHGSNTQFLSAAHASLWKSIITTMNSLKEQGIDIMSHFKIRIGNRLCTSFWKDIWIGDLQLQFMFPRLFALESFKDISVAAKLQGPLLSSFHRGVRGGAESHQYELLSSLLEPVILSNSVDRWVCYLNREGAFKVKDIRLLIDESFLPNSDTPTRWVKSVSIKINVFAWKVSLDRLPTRFNLARRNVAVASTLCPICNQAPEDSSHLFFGCSIVALICRWWNLNLYLPSPYVDWLNWFSSISLETKLKAILEGVFFVTWWCSWSFRNQLLFSKIQPRKEFLFDDIVFRSFNWCLARRRVQNERCNTDERVVCAGDQVMRPSITDGLMFTWDNNCTIEFDTFGFFVKDFLSRHILLRCDSSGDLYPVTQSSSLLSALMSLISSTWHQLLDHPGDEVLRSLVSRNFISYNKEKSQHVCHACQLGKRVKHPYSSSTSIVSSCFDIIHSDILTSPIVSTGGFKYYVIFPDHFLIICVYVLFKLSEEFAKFVHFRLNVTNQFKSTFLVFNMIMMDDTRKTTQRLNLHVYHISPIPKFLSLALFDPYWRDAMYDEYNALIKNCTLVLVPRPSGANILRCLWLFRHKFHADGSLTWYKARVVANGSSQQLGIDCDETFSPVVKAATIRIVLSLALTRHWFVHQLAVKNAFLNDDLSNIVYMHQPLSFVDPRYPNHVCLLQRSLYGLKQAHRAWFHRFAAYATRVGFSSSRCDSSLFIYRSGTDTTYILIYVDDVVLISSSTTLLQKIIFSLHKGKKYSMNLLRGAHMLNCNPTWTPIDTESKLGLEGTPISDPTLYRSLADGLHCLTFTRPDLSYVMQHICLYMHDPREPHLAALKRILCYVQGTFVATIFYHGVQRDNTLSHVIVQKLNIGALLTLSLRRHGYAIFFENYTPILTATLVYCDNVSAVYLSANPVQHQRTKQIKIDIHFVRDMVAMGNVRVLYVPSRYQYADIFSKGIPLALFEEFRTIWSV
nr:RNA-directed DNA polymerase, eukaryota [Tanacetum cinerariifolium]